MTVIENSVLEGKPAFKMRHWEKDEELALFRQPTPVLVDYLVVVLSGEILII